MKGQASKTAGISQVNLLYYFVFSPKVSAQDF